MLSMRTTVGRVHKNVFKNYIYIPSTLFNLVIRKGILAKMTIIEKQTNGSRKNKTTSDSWFSKECRKEKKIDRRHGKNYFGQDRRRKSSITDKKNR